MALLILVFAHLLADYPLQGEFLSSMKGKNWLLLLSHAGIWAGTIATAGYLIGLNVTLIDVILLFVVHAIADHLKATNKLWYRNTDNLKEGLLIDQLIHVGQMLLFMYMN